MATPIIAALRQRRDLKESLLHTAQELAHRASVYGVARVSYNYLARKCHCSRRTVMRHIQRLIDAGIVRKSVLWIRGNCCEVNTYAFLLAWETRRPEGVVTQWHPIFHRQREKNSSVRAELANQQKMLRAFTPGSGLWERIREEIARLEALLAPDGDVTPPYLLGMTDAREREQVPADLAPV